MSYDWLIISEKMDIKYQLSTEIVHPKDYASGQITLNCTPKVLEERF
jgi:hypothetical protein